MQNTDDLLNAIASGSMSKIDIQHRTGISYPSVYRGLSLLVQDHQLIEHEIRNGKHKIDYFYTLSYAQRWRLYNFAHVPLVFELQEPYIFSISDCEPFINFSGINIYQIDHTRAACPLESPFFSQRFLYVRCTEKTLLTTLEKIDSEREAQNFLPAFLLYHEQSLSKTVVNLISFIMRYKFPLFFTSDADTILVYSPPVVAINFYPSDITEKIFQQLPKDGTTLSILETTLQFARETIRRHLNILVSRQKVEKIKKSPFLDIVWKPII